MLVHGDIGNSGSAGSSHEENRRHKYDWDSNGPEEAVPKSVEGQNEAAEGMQIRTYESLVSLMAAKLSKFMPKYPWIILSIYTDDPTGH